MTFRFNIRGASPGGAPSVLEMALEATYPDGGKVQAMHFTERHGVFARRHLVYRHGISGRWLNSEGISFKGLPRTPENLVRSIGRADPVDETYVLPAT